MAEIKSTQEILNKISPLPLTLEISDNGNLKLNGDINSDDLQPILDNSFLRYQIFLNHQKNLERENNLISIYIGIIFSVLFGLSIYCCFNLQSQTQSNLEFYYGINGQYLS